MIDLHAHSDASDGSWSPSRLVDEALKMGLEALAIADHDTLRGYDLATGPARQLGLDLVCAVEIGTVFLRREQPPVELGGLFNPLLLHQVKTPVPCHVRNSTEHSIVLVTGRRPRVRRRADRHHGRPDLRGQGRGIRAGRGPGPPVP